MVTLGLNKAEEIQAHMTDNLKMNLNYLEMIEVVKQYFNDQIPGFGWWGYYIPSVLNCKVNVE